MRTHACTHAHARTHAPTHARTHARTHAPTHARTHARRRHTLSRMRDLCDGWAEIFCFPTCFIFFPKPNCSYGVAVPFCLSRCPHLEAIDRLGHLVSGHLFINIRGRKNSFISKYSKALVTGNIIILFCVTLHSVERNERLWHANRHESGTFKCVFRQNYLDTLLNIIILF